MRSQNKAGLKTNYPLNGLQMGSVQSPRIHSTTSTHSILSNWQGLLHCHLKFPRRIFYMHQLFLNSNIIKSKACGLKVLFNITQQQPALWCHKLCSKSKSGLCFLCNWLRWGDVLWYLIWHLTSSALLQYLQLMSDPAWALSIWSSL